MPDIPDYTFKGGNFPMASVIEAAQRKAQLEQQNRDQGNKSLVEGLQAIGGIGQSLVDKRLKVAQSLALGKTLFPNMSPDIVKNMEPDQIIKAKATQSGEGSPLWLLLGAHPELLKDKSFLTALAAGDAQHPPLAQTSQPQPPSPSGAGTRRTLGRNSFVKNYGQDVGSKLADYMDANPGSNETDQAIYSKLVGSSPAQPNAADPAPSNGVILASDTTTTPVPTVDQPASPPPGLNNPNQIRAPGVNMPVPIQAPPSTPAPTPDPMTTLLNRPMSKGQMASFKMGQAAKSQSVYSYDNKGHLVPVGEVPKGAVIEKEPTIPFDSTQFIGNTPDGKPLLLHRDGTITTGKTPEGGPVLPRNSTQPTAATRSTAEFAKTLIPHFDSLRALIQKADAQGYIGPGAGRLYGEFLTGKVGSTGNADADKLLGKLRAVDALMKTGAMKVHFGSRGGTIMYDHFSDMLNSGKQSAAVLNGALDGMQEFIQGYADAGTPGGPPAPSSPSQGTPGDTGLPQVGDAYNGGKVLSIKRIK